MNKKNYIMRSRRQALKLSQTELAQLVGVSQNTISTLENGDSDVSLSLALAICGALNLAPHCLPMLIPGMAARVQKHLKQDPDELPED